MAIGRFGSLKFKVNGSRQFTFSSLTMEQGLNIAEHTTPGWKGHAEVTGEKLDEASMHVVLMVELGVRPYAMYQKVRKKMRYREVNYLILGNHKLMDRRCIISGISENFKTVLWDGKVQGLEMDIKFKEYN